MWDAQEKVDELELYVQMQEEHYADWMAEMVDPTIVSLADPIEGSNRSILCGLSRAT